MNFAPMVSSRQSPLYTGMVERKSAAKKLKLELGSKSVFASKLTESYPSLKNLRARVGVRPDVSFPGSKKLPSDILSRPRLEPPS